LEYGSDFSKNIITMTQKNNQGFTLIEIMVAVSIFTVVALITTGALVTINNVNRKAQAIKIAIDNVSFAIDSMITNLREGAQFGCITGTVNNNASTYLASQALYLNRGCTGNGQGIIFESKRIGSTNYILYRFFENASSQGSIQTASTASTAYVDLTSPEVDIQSLRFYVPNGVPNPRTTIVVTGEVLGKTPTKFNLQTTVKANF